MPIPKEVQGQKYICLITFRKNRAAVNTPVWFAERDDKLYVQTRNDSGKYKRIRNNPHVRVAPCTIRGKVIGPEFAGKARFYLRSNGSQQRKPSAANTGWHVCRSGAARMNT